MSKPIITDLYDGIADSLEFNFNKLRIEKMWLGGGPGANGGSGVRPGGFYGHLIQTYVAYDTTEAETLAGSGTLLDNLNHIRYRIGNIETNGAGGAALNPVIARWQVPGGTLELELPDMAYQVLFVTASGLILDPLTYTLTDYTTIVLDTPISSGTILTAQYIALTE